LHLFSHPLNQDLHWGCFILGLENNLRLCSLRSLYACCFPCPSAPQPFVHAHLSSGLGFPALVSYVSSTPVCASQFRKPSFLFSNMQQRPPLLLSPMRLLPPSQCPLCVQPQIFAFGWSVRSCQCSPSLPHPLCWHKYQWFCQFLQLAWETM